MQQLHTRDWLIITVVSVIGGVALVALAEIFWAHP